MFSWECEAVFASHPSFTSGCLVEVLSQQSVGNESLCQFSVALGSGIGLLSASHLALQYDK